MRSSTARLGLSAAALSLVVLAGWSPASAGASAPNVLVVKDAADDSVGGQADMEIVGLTLTTAGTTETKKVGKKTVKAYTPKRFLVKLELGAPPSANPLTNYQVVGTTSKCGDMSLYYDGQNLASGGFLTECGSDGTVPGGSQLFLEAPEVVGSAIVWTVPYTLLPPEMKGGQISGIHGFLSFAEPMAFGHGTHLAGIYVDEVTSTSSYTIG